MARRDVHTLDSEVEFPADEQLVSTTDLRGVITYANPAFCRIAGYPVEELVGHNHNLVRHPDMPKAAFADLWARLKEGKPWRGMVKNRCKDGRYYWVDAYVTPIYEGNRISGYQSVRCKPDPQLKRIASQTYQALLKAERGTSSRLPSLARARLPLLALLLLGLLGWAASSQGPMTALLMLLPLLLIGGTYWRELFALPLYLQQLGREYDSLTRLRATSPHSEIIVVGQFPHWSVSLAKNLMDYLAQNNHFPRHMRQGLDARYQQWDEYFRSHLDQPHTRYLSAQQVLCEPSGCLTSVDGSVAGLTAVDWGHLTKAGSIYLAEQLAPRIFE